MPHRERLAAPRLVPARRAREPVHAQVYALAATESTTRVAVDTSAARVRGER